MKKPGTKIGTKFTEEHKQNISRSMQGKRNSFKSEGIRRVTLKGYIIIRVKDLYVYEHRFIMENYLGRKLFKKYKQYIKQTLVLFLISILLVVPAYASNPKFKLHVLKIDNLTGVNYAINYPVIIDYDRDGDMDILIMSKEGSLYFLENLDIP